MRVRIAAFAGAMLLVAACAAVQDAHTPKTVHGGVVAPYATHQECVQLTEGDRLDYRFASTEPLRFAIQYREGVAVLEPIVRDATREDAGIYPVSESRVYCLVWEAGAAGASLDYRFVTRR